MERVRLMKKRDLEKCSQILEEAYSEEPYNERFSAGSALKYISGKYKLGKKHSFVIEDENSVKGFILSSLSYWSNGPQAIIEELVVEKSSRGKGFSTSLLDYAENHLRDLGVKSIMLWTRKDSVAHKIDLKRGYRDAKDLTLMFKGFD